MRKKPLTPGLSKMKAKLKVMAENLRIYKNKIKGFQKKISSSKNEKTKCSCLKEIRDFKKKLNMLSIDFRHTHIAYCELRGTS